MLGGANTWVFEHRACECMPDKIAGMELPSTAVTGLDACVRKPLVATCALDKAVRIWNWQDMTLELVKFFPDEAFAISIHPNGMLLLVGFADKLRLMTVLMDDLKVPLILFSLICFQALRIQQAYELTGLAILLDVCDSSVEQILMLV
jgi:hypothetical protein